MPTRGGNLIVWPGLPVRWGGLSEKWSSILQQAGVLLALLGTTVTAGLATEVADVVPGRIIVKFRDSLTASATDLVANRQPFASALTDGSDSLDRLNEALGVTAADAVFDPRPGMSLSERRANLQSMLSAAKSRFPRRAARAPAGAPAAPDLSNIYQLSFPPETDPDIACIRYRMDPHVEWCQPDYVISLSFVPNDPYFKSSGAWGQPSRDLWGLRSINMKGAWDGTQGEDVVVAVVDSGLDFTHPDIADNVWSNPGEVANGIDDDGNGYIDDLHGWDFIEGDNMPQDENGHGTHVAGTIAAVGNNGLGIIGVAPQARIMPVRAFNAAGGSSSTILAAALLYASRWGADVMNNSWSCGGSCFSHPLFEETVRTASDLGVVVVFAAGNADDDVFNYSPVNMTGPGARPVVVAANDRYRRPSRFLPGRATNYGATVDVSAPGGGEKELSSIFDAWRNVLSLNSAVCDAERTCPPDLVVGDLYLRQAGTSMATPHVSGVAALILACNPDFEIDDVRSILQAAGRKTKPDKDRVGFGQIDALAAVRYAGAGRAQLRAPGRLVGLPRAGGPVAVRGTAKGPGFRSWQLYAGRGTAPTKWSLIGSGTQPVDDGFLTNWDVGTQPGGIYTLRLLVRNNLPSVRRVAGSCGAFRPSSGARSRYIQEVQYVVVDDVIRLTSDDSLSYRNPTVAGGYVAAEVRPAGTALGPTLGIALINIATRAVSLVGTPGSTGPAFDPQNPDRFVYTRSQNGVPEIYLHVISSGANVPVTAVGSALRFMPSMYGSHVLWVDTRNGPADIYAHNLGTGTQQRLTDGSAPHVSPHVSGSRAVWQKGNQFPLPLGLHLYNLATGTPQVALATDPRAQAVCPATSGNWVTWTTAAPLLGPNQVYAYNTSTMEVRQLSSPSASSIHSCTAIDGNLAIWVAYQSAAAVLQAYDLQQNVGPTSITFNPMSSPTGDIALSPEWLVWSDYWPAGTPQIHITPRS